MLDIDCRRVLHVWDGQRQAGEQVVQQFMATVLGRLSPIPRTS